MSKTANGRLLDRILEPVSSSLNAEAARKLIGLKADSRTQARVAKLADKCNEDTLTPRERREYEMYVMVGHIIALCRPKLASSWPAASNRYEAVDPRAGPLTCRSTLRVLPFARAR